MELVIEPFIDRLNWSRKKATVVVAIAFWICGLPAAYNFNWLTVIDAYFSTIFFPLMGVIAPIALFKYLGRGKALETINNGAKIRIGDWWVSWGKYVYPILVLIVVLIGVLELLKVF
jgi:NSS family neurotransmitter:Na+ symporter